MSDKHPPRLTDYGAFRQALADALAPLCEVRTLLDVTENMVHIRLAIGQPEVSISFRVASPLDD
jgi:hypothetical protein